MSTLIKYSNFKRMKQNSAKAKNNTNSRKKAEAEMSAFLRLLNKAKEKKA